MKLRVLVFLMVVLAGCSKDEINERVVLKDNDSFVFTYSTQSGVDKFLLRPNYLYQIINTENLLQEDFEYELANDLLGQIPSNLLKTSQSEYPSKLADGGRVFLELWTNNKGKRWSIDIGANDADAAKFASKVHDVIQVIK